MGANIPDIEVKPKYSIKDIIIELKAGDRLELSGSNGPDKTTLLKFSSDGLPPTSGEVEYRGR